MEVKKNLNNVQRKMLDEIYTEQFQKRANLITVDREAGRRLLQTQLLTKEASNKKVKEMLEAGKKFFLLEQELRTELAANGVAVNPTLSRQPELSINQYRSDGQYKELEDYQKATNAIELALSEKKKEMRAKIYGVAASYEDVDAEIKELLKDI